MTPRTPLSSNRFSHFSSEPQDPRLPSGLGGHRRARVLTVLAVLASVAAVGSAATASAARRSKRGGTQPQIASSCKKAQTRSLLVEAKDYARSAAKHLDHLSTIYKPARQTTWDGGDEGRWFGRYRPSHLTNVARRMRKITKILSSSRLKIGCDRKFNGYVRASPGAYKIVLGKNWLNIPQKQVDKTQKIVRAAARIAGAVLGGKAHDDFGVVGSIQLARTRGTGTPAKAIRTDENLGYYAVCRSPHRQKIYCPR